MRSIREYIKASLSDSSHILYTNTHSVPRVVEGEALLEIGIDRRTSPGGAVCTMWNIL